MYNNVPVPNICDMIRVHVYHMAARPGWPGTHMLQCISGVLCAHIER